MRERRKVPSVHFVGSDPEPLLHDTAHELGGKEPIVATQQETGRHGGPCAQRPWLLERCVGLLSFSPLQRRGNHLARDIVKESGHHIKGCIRPTAVTLIL